MKKLYWNSIYEVSECWKAMKFQWVIPTEQEEQEKLVAYLDLKKCKYSAIPNSTYTTSWNQKNKNKKMWVKPWIPDMFIIANNHSFFIEMKRLKWWVVSDFQKEWIEAINKTWINAYICRWFDEAREIVDSYLK